MGISIDISIGAGIGNSIDTAGLYTQANRLDDG